MTSADVLVRATTARKYLEVGDIVMGSDPADRQVAAGLAALASIAASDAICGARLGFCAHGQDHGQAADLIATVPGGPALAQSLRRVLRDKGNAHYGTSYLSIETVTAMLRHARALVDALDVHLR
ncbi:hypothetical protein QUV83_09930 [Cellulomonas cellasea]|uniref:hypothetical protein n=1 Tax=Cellulomonas cellasea TaxID=43670 RepID=UPI0025A3DD37|nr:hypothetical protein [Cellulomonas cellasea]MDM8085082.1 hypothetical protein [Cellulomonas cellasea]